MISNLKRFAISFLLWIICFNEALSQENNRLIKISVEEFEKSTIFSIGDFNSKKVNRGFEPVEFTEELMNMAQAEAEKLNKLGKLTMPVLSTNKNFIGYAFKLTGVIGKIFSIL